MVLINGVLDVWCSFMERCVTAPITEAEYISLSKCIQTICIHCRIQQKLEKPKDATVFYDIACFPFHGLPNRQAYKDVEVRYHICRKAAINEVVGLEYYPTTEICADSLTKALGFHTFSCVKPLMSTKRSLLNAEEIKKGHFVEAECWSGKSRTFILCYNDGTNETALLDVGTVESALLGDGTIETAPLDEGSVDLETVWKFFYWVGTTWLWPYLWNNSSIEHHTKLEDWFDKCDSCFAFN